jgi:hypothetical protein
MSASTYVARLFAALHPFAVTVPLDGDPRVLTFYGRFRVRVEARPSAHPALDQTPLTVQLHRSLHDPKFTAIVPPYEPAAPYRVTDYGFAVDPVPHNPFEVFNRLEALLGAIGLYPRGREPWNTPETCGTCGGSTRDPEGRPGECGACDGRGSVPQGLALCPYCEGAGWLHESVRPRVARRATFSANGEFYRDPVPPRCWCRPSLPDPRLEAPGVRTFWTPMGVARWELEHVAGRPVWTFCGGE